MPRPLRLEYENAFYHVMNRGRGRQAIFHCPAYYQAFIDCMVQAHERFGAVFHAYCLMGNHYHLLIQTPLANISRIMRHINGVYTQHYNWRKNTDGPLFRGRYKAIVVDADAYLLQVSRYIHRNPIETKKPLVQQLEKYRWSSYPAYLKLHKPPGWLHRDLIYRLLLQRPYAQAYQRYVAAGVDEETARFYSKGNIASVLGDQLFREALAEDQPSYLHKATELTIHGKADWQKIIELVSKAFSVDAHTIVQQQLGRQQSNFPRKVAMYLCQSGGFQLGELVDKFGIKSPGTISNAIAHVRKVLADDKKMLKSVETIKRRIWI